MLILPFICSFLTLRAYGDEATEATYFVKPLLPENQRKDVSDYYDVRLANGNEQVLQLEIHNNTAEKMRFTTEIENAITNDHGVIEYQHEEVKYDDSLKHKMTDVAKTKDVIEVEGGSLSKVEVAVTMPKEDFDGIILGGIRVSEKLSDEAVADSGISNVFSYVIPIKLWQTDTAIPNKLNFKGVTIGQQSFENVIKARLQNPQAEILRELTLEAKVFKKDGKEAVYEEKQEAMKLAPNSSFDYSISLGTKEFKAGKYRLELTAKAEGLDETWTEAFEISGEEAKKLNQGMVFKEKTNWGMYALIAAFVVAVFVIGYLLYRQRQLQQKSKKATETTKMKKRKRSKKQTTKLMLVLLAAASLGIGHRAYAETANQGVSDATILIKPQESGTDDSTTPSTQPAKGTSKSSTKKVLPQTGESKKNKQMVSLGSVILVCATAVFIKKERGQNDEE